jgi:hypothetical protein
VNLCRIPSSSYCYVHIEFQAHLTTHETLQAKASYELMSRDLGVIVQSFLTDNGSAFASKEFASQLAKFEQVIRFAGTGAHHHNAIAERNIQTIMAIARTMMLHSAVHWPEVADACLWPMAVQHAVFLHDHMPNDLTDVSPHDVFTRSRWEQRKFHDLHVWGCPACCLEKAMHDGKKLPRWKPRSHRTMNMGLSAKHAIVFEDDWFATVAASMESLPDLNSPDWSQIFGDSTFQFSFDDKDDNGEPTVEVNADLPVALARSHNAVSTAVDKHSPSIPLPTVPVAEEPLQPAASSPILVEAVDEPSFRPGIVFPPREPPSPNPREPSSPSPREPINPGNVCWKMPLDTATRRRREISQESTPTRASPSSSQPQFPSPVSSSLRRWSRSAGGQSPNRLIQGSSDQMHLGKGPSRQTPAAHLVHIEEADPSYFYESSSNLSSFPSCSIPTAFLVATQPGLTAMYDLNGITQPHAFKASKSDPDILSYDKAMADVDREVWIEAAKKEIKSLEEHGTWTEVDASEAASRILPSQWVFKCKVTRRPHCSKR